MSVYFSLFGLEVLESGNAGDVTTDNLSLYINGSIGTLCTSGIPLYEQGFSTISSGIPLYTIGSIPSNSGIPLYVYGSSNSNSGIPLYILTGTPVNSGIPLYIYGKDSNNSGVPLFIQAGVPVSGGIPLYINNYLQTNNITLYIGDLGNRIDKGLSLFLKNPGAESGLPLSVWGGSYSVNPDITLNGVPIYNSIYLFIEGQGSYGSIPLYLNSATGQLTQDMSLCINSSQSVNSGIPLVIPNLSDINTDRIKLYTHGF